MDSKNNSGNWNSGDWNSGNWNSGDSNSGNWNSGNWNSGDWNSGNWNSGDWNSGNSNSGDWNSGNWNSGDSNSGDWNSGHFNTIDGVFTLFNKPTIKIDLPFFDIRLNEWISEENMSDDEKKKNPKFFVTKGYLKTVPYKDAWSIFWNGATKEQKDIITSLPNFDAAIFFEITGIDLSVDTDKIKQGMIKEAEELMKKGMELLNKAKGII